MQRQQHRWHDLTNQCETHRACTETGGSDLRVSGDVSESRDSYGTSIGGMLTLSAVNCLCAVANCAVVCTSVASIDDESGSVTNRRDHSQFESQRHRRSVARTDDFHILYELMCRCLK